MRRQVLCRKLALSALFFGLILGLPQDAHAIFSLSVSPRRGGRDIRFEESQPGNEFLRNEEVVIRVENTTGKPYLIKQRLFQPLMNQLGNVIPQDAFIFFSPSSPLGTLIRIQQETPIFMGQNTIFTSNNAGDSDEFLLVYNIRIPENLPGGIYHTQITFMAEPATPEAGMSPSVVTLDVRVEIRPTFRIEVQSDKSSKVLDLGRVSKDNAAAIGTLNFKIDSNIGTTYRIAQQMTGSFMSQEGEILDEEVFQVVSAGGQHGSLPGSGSPIEVSQAPQVVYSSDPTGQSDIFQLQYVVKPGSAQKAGIYRTNLAFKVESLSPLVSTNVISVPVTLIIEPIFYLETQMEGVSNLHFGTFKTREEARQNKVVITIYSNLGEAYQVSQVVSRKLTNQEGSSIPEDNFIFYGADAKTGTLTTQSPTSIKEGDTVVFRSDSRGTPEKFVLMYSLSIPPDTREGSYSSDLKYSITTL